MSDILLLEFYYGLSVDRLRFLGLFSLLLILSLINYSSFGHDICIFVLFFNVFSVILCSLSRDNCFLKGFIMPFVAINSICSRSQFYYEFAQELCHCYRFCLTLNENVIIEV